MVKIVCINGMPRAGKDTVAEMAASMVPYYRVKNVSTVDFVKDVAKFCGWNGDKTPQNRKFLSDLKDLLAEWDDIPFRKVKMAYEIFKFRLESNHILGNALMFVHTREPEEIQRFKDELGAVSLLVRRPAIETNEQSNHADMNVFNCEYDYEIMNDGSLEELEEKVKKFLDEVM